jgi:hypothetical protein
VLSISLVKSSRDTTRLCRRVLPKPDGRHDGLRPAQGGVATARNDAATKAIKYLI